jgi:uncharacterized protein
MGMLSDKELSELVPAHEVDSGTPVPTRLVASDEYLPIAQTERQKKVEAQMNALGDEYGRRNGLSRRRFFQTAAGMTTAYLAMNEVYGPLFGASPAEARSIELAQAGRSSRRPAGWNGPATSPTSPPSTGSATSMAISASSSP